MIAIITFVLSAEIAPRSLCKDAIIYQLLTIHQHLTLAESRWLVTLRPAVIFQRYNERRSRGSGSSLPGVGEHRPSRHFKEELAKEFADLNDAFDVLRTGNIFDPPEPDIKTGEWKDRIEGTTVDGLRLAIIFQFRSENSSFLITIFSIEKMSR